MKLKEFGPREDRWCPKQECIPVGCLPSAAVAVSGRGGCLPKGFVCPRVSDLRGVCLRGVCWKVSGGVCWGVSAWTGVGVSAWVCVCVSGQGVSAGGLCPGGVYGQGVSAGSVCPGDGGVCPGGVSDQVVYTYLHGQNDTRL